MHEFEHQPFSIEDYMYSPTEAYFISTPVSHCVERYLWNLHETCSNTLFQTCDSYIPQPYHMHTTRLMGNTVS